MIPPIANRFVAGETEAGAIDYAEELNGRGVGAILNRLGEHYRSPEPAEADAEAYLDLLDALDAAGVRACVSVKPSQVGLDVDEALFRENVGRIAARGARRSRSVWLDMEDHTTTDATLAAFESAAADHPSTLGVALQANLKRTVDDLEAISGVPGKVRLVKGAYDPPAEVAYRGAEVDEAYRELIDRAFDRFNGSIAVATHDQGMLDHAADRAVETGRDFEIQMLMGVRERLQYELAGSHDVWQYVPFGGRWAAYFARRLAERKENVLFALRAVLGR